MVLDATVRGCLAITLVELVIQLVVIAFTTFSTIMSDSQSEKSQISRRSHFYLRHLKTTICLVVLLAMFNVGSETATDVENNWNSNLLLTCIACLSLKILSHTYSFLVEEYLFFGKQDRLQVSHDMSAIGYGLALSYWYGFLKLRTIPEAGDIIKHCTITQRMERTGLDFKVPKLVLLVPNSCDFEKGEEKWMEKYHMKKIKEEEDPLIRELENDPVVQKHLRQREQLMGCNAAQVFCRPPVKNNAQEEQEKKKEKNPSFFICFDFPTTLKSALSLSKRKLNISPEQRMSCVDQFVDTLKGLLERNGVQGMVQVVRYEDSRLSETHNIYHILLEQFTNQVTI